MTDSLIAVRAAQVSKKFARRLKHSVRYGLQDMARTSLGFGRNSNRLRREEFWAVRDVSFELRRGEVLGLIGANGSGKSTLLSMLNGIYRPDDGEIAVRGRVAALIQIGAGFHPMLTGRENIFVNGAILGMSKAEITNKLDAIVDFAGVGEFIDLPVKHYSSGMYVRLGFSIAAHLEPDVLLVDEMLAVGDAEFRAKSMERMWRMVKDGAVSIIFVSHNMLAVEGFCDRILLLDRGQAQSGPKSELIARYCGDHVGRRHERIAGDAREKLVAPIVDSSVATGDLEVRSIRITDGHGIEKEYFRPSDALQVQIELNAQRRLEGVIASLVIEDPNRLVISVERSKYHGAPPFTFEGQEKLLITIDPLNLKSGAYFLRTAFQDPTLESVYCLGPSTIFRVADEMPNPSGHEGFYRPNLSWKHERGGEKSE